MSRARARYNWFYTRVMPLSPPRVVSSAEIGRLAFLIVGTPRSGTTLVRRLANEFPDVRVPPETHFFGRYIWPLLQPGTFPLGGAALRKQIERFTELRTSHALDLNVDRVYTRLSGNCFSVFDLFTALVCELTDDAPYSGEKTPGHLHWWEPLAGQMLHLKFIGVVRDARSVVASNLRMPWGPKSVTLQAERWSFDQRLIQKMQSRLKERCLILRYEDVVTGPDVARDQIARFLGLQRHSIDRAPSRDVGGPLLPGEEWKLDSVENISTQRMEAWREELAAEQADQVAAICRRELRSFNYAEIPDGLSAIRTQLAIPSTWRMRRARYRISVGRKFKKGKQLLRSA
jgi:hypothetical protein